MPNPMHSNYCFEAFTNEQLEIKKSSGQSNRNGPILFSFLLKMPIKASAPAYFLK